MKKRKIKGYIRAKMRFFKGWVLFDDSEFGW